MAVEEFYNGRGELVVRGTNRALAAFGGKTIWVQNNPDAVMVVEELAKQLDESYKSRMYLRRENQRLRNVIIEERKRTPAHTYEPGDLI